MALQWMILTYLVAAEAALAIILTLPAPKAIKSRIVSLVSLILQPAMFILPFSAFQLLGPLFFPYFPVRALIFVSAWWFVELFLVTRHILENGAPLDVHRRDLHCLWARSLREIGNFFLSFLSSAFYAQLLYCTVLLYFITLYQIDIALWNSRGENLVWLGLNSFCL